MKVYLSGGLKSNWQDKVMGRIHDDVKFFDPREHDYLSPEDYTERDLEMIKNSDIIFAYIEKDNPMPIGLALEIGYASGIGNKFILLVNEKETDGYEIVEECAHKKFKKLEYGIRYLRNNLLYRF